MNTLPEAPNQLDLLAFRVQALEQRVDAMEHAARPVVVLAPAAASLSAAPLQTAEASLADSRTMPSATGALSAFGVALLGIAGAYLLRAVSGASLLPRELVAAIAALYATGWLVAAARIGERRFAAALYATTSILIFAPMLWEMSIHFQAMTAMMAVVLLALYAAVATFLGRVQAGSAIASVAFAGGACTAVALSLGTHHMLPFSILLLAMAAVCEALPAGEYVRTARIVVALCADVSVWMLIFVYRLPAAERTDYPTVAAGAILTVALVLFLLQVAVVVYWSILRVQAITVFHVLQSVVAFVLLLSAIGLLTPDAGAIALGLPCLLLGGACTAAAYGRFRQGASTRNFRVFASLGTVLLPVGTFLLAPVGVASAIVGIAGLVAVYLAGRTQSVALELQGVLYLSLAAAASGFLQFVSQTLVGALPGAFSWQFILIAALAAAAFAIASETPGEPAYKQVLHLVPCLLGAAGIAAISTRLLVSLVASRTAPEVFHIAVLRTLTLCAVASLLAFAGTRLHRLQMKRVAYLTLLVVVAKLLFEDLRHGRVEFIAASIFLVALTLLAVPRLARIAEKRDA